MGINSVALKKAQKDFDERFEEVCDELGGEPVPDKYMDILYCKFTDTDMDDFVAFSKWMKRNMPSSPDKEYVATYGWEQDLPFIHAEFGFDENRNMEAYMEARDLTSSEGILFGLEEEVEELGIHGDAVDSKIEEAYYEWQDRYPKSIKALKRYLGNISLDLEYDNVFDNWEFVASLSKDIRDSESIKHVFEDMEKEVTRVVNNHVDFPTLKEGD